MDLQHSFDVLSTVLEQYECGGRAVRRIETESAAGAGLQATMEVAVPLETAVDDATASLTDDGSLRVECPEAGLPSLPERVESTVTRSTREVRLAEEGVVVASVALTVERADTDPGDGSADEDLRTDGSAVSGTGEVDTREADASEESAGPLSAVRDDSVPPYEDTPYLRALYETCDTFAEMSREIEMDVSSETVRRYMIEAGVHDPTSYDGTDGGTQSGEDERDHESTAGGDDERAAAGPAEDSDTTTEDPMATIPNEQLVADGIGLPADLTIEDVAHAVVGSSTMYQVHRRLGIEQDEARELLRRLDLIDLVLHRIGGRPEGAPSYEEVATRIRECTPQSHG